MRVDDIGYVPQRHRRALDTDTIVGRVYPNEALPLTDEACFGCGSDRRFMTNSGKPGSVGTDERSKRLQEAKPARPEPGE